MAPCRVAAVDQGHRAAHWEVERLRGQGKTRGAKKDARRPFDFGTGVFVQEGRNHCEHLIVGRIQTRIKFSGYSTAVECRSNLPTILECREDHYAANPLTPNSSASGSKLRWTGPTSVRPIWSAR